MNDADILESIRARDTLRREVGLPRLDIEREVKHAHDVATAAAARERYKTLCEAHADERQRIRDEIINEMRAGGNTTFPNGWSGNYYLHTIVNRRFSAFLKTLDDDSTPPV